LGGVGIGTRESFKKNVLNVKERVKKGTVDLVPFLDICGGKRKGKRKKKK
jgi:hypothetical protein